MEYKTSLLKCVSFSSSRREYPSLHFPFLLHHTKKLVFPFHLALKICCLILLELCLLMGSVSRSIMCSSFKYFSNSLPGLFLFVPTYMLPLRRKNRKTVYACPVTGKGEWLLAPSSHVSINMMVTSSLLSFHTWIATLALSKYLAYSLILHCLLSRNTALSLCFCYFCLTDKMFFILVKIRIQHGRGNKLVTPKTRTHAEREIASALLGICGNKSFKSAS